MFVLECLEDPPFVFYRLNENTPGIMDGICNLIQLMEFVKSEWDQVVGITRQRKGDVKASETASGINAARYQSSVISERVFSKFEEFVQKELIGLLDYSKLAWLDGKKRLHINSDLRAAILNIDPAEYSNSEFGIVVTNSAKDIEQLQMTKQFAQAFAQNGASPSAVVDVIRANSMAKVHQLLKKGEAEAMEAAQGAAQSQEEAEQRKIELAAEYAQLEKEADRLFMHQEYDRKEDIEMLKLSGVDQNPNGEFQAAQVSLKNQELVQKQQKDMTDAQLKNKEIESKERIENKKAEVALKNKVVGEK